MKLSVSFQRIVLILLCFLFSLTELMAAVVPESSASRIAGDFVFWNSGSRAGSGTLRLAHVVKSGGADRIYIYNVDGGGWVMVSGDDNTRRQVLGYSPTGRFDYSAMPVNAKSWIESYADVISRLESHPEYIRRDSVMQSRASGAVAPLLGEISWDQGEPYNLLCPTLSNGERAVTGCVATAMAQIMMYHRYPAAGQGRASYEWNGQTLSVDFGKYDWDLMAPKYTGNESEASRQAVATLMRDCGYSVKADYGDVTPAYVVEASKAFTSFFGYDTSLLVLPHSHCDTESWEGILREELNNKRPVLYSGTGNNGGHAFVCDGYDDKGYFHFNWGWGGVDDGYFITGEHFFPYDQLIIYGIQPYYGGKAKGYLSINKLRTGVNSLGFTATYSLSYHENTTIEIGYGIENVETGEKRTYSLNEFGRSTGETLEKTFLPEVTGLEDGNYIVYPLMRCEGETEWSNCFYQEYKFSSGEKKNWDIIVKDGQCILPGVSRVIDGITFSDEYINGGVYGVDVIDINSDMENLVIPSKVTIGSETYKIHRIFINEKENLLSLTTDALYVSINGCPNFKTLNHNGTTLMGGCDSPVLKNIILTEALTNYSFYITDNGGTLKEIKFPIKRQGLHLEGQHLSNLGTIDIYLYSDIPPIFGNKELLENTEITFHIPAGTKGIYSNAGFDKIGTLVEETTASTYNVEWGLNGGIYNPDEAGMGIGAGSNDVEFAVKMNRNAAETYKGNKITAITYVVGRDSEVSYVFLSNDDKGYITRKSVDAQPGVVTTVYFDKPYTITGEPIYFGIGNRHSLGIKWATTEYGVQDNMYIRLVGDDYGFCRLKPGKWEYRGGADLNSDGFFQSLAYPLPISITIEGENIPVDASILSINVEGADKVSEPGSRNADGAQTQSGKQVGENGLYRYTKTADGIGKMEFADDMTFSRGEQPTVNNNSVEDKIPEVKLFDDQCTVTVRVQNRSEKKIHSLKFKTTAGGKEFITEYPKTLAVNQTALIPVSFPIKDLADEFTVNTSVAEVEGNVDNIPDDGNTSARVMNYSRSETYPLKAVVEKATSATKYDRYESSQKKLEEELPDNFIVIDIHYDDEMAKPENYDPMDNWVYMDLPRTYSNRMSQVEDMYIKDGPYGMETTVNFEKKKNKATESVKITKAVTNGEECEVSAVVSTAYPAEGKSFALAFVVVEDQVGPYPKQCNTGKVDDNNQWILETRDELFDNVARGIYGEFNGMTGLLPEKMTTNASYPVTYSFTMPKNIQNLDNTKIVALLLDDSGLMCWEKYSVIANADRMKLEVDRNMSGVDEVTEDADDIIKVEGNRIYTTVSCERFEVFTIDGKRTVSENLAKGFYVARAVVNGRTYVKKVVI